MKRIIFFIFIVTLFSGRMKATDVNYVTNSTFEDGVGEWIPFNNNGTHTFTHETDSPIAGEGSALVTITNGTSDGSSGESWRLGSRMLLSTFKNATYHVQLKARASRNVQIRAMMQQFFSPYASFGGKLLDITTETKEFSFDMINDKGVGGVWNFVMEYGHLTTGDQIWIDDVRITETSQTDGNACNGDFEEDIKNYLSNTYGGWQSSVSSPLTHTFEIDQTNPLSGTRSMKVTNTGTEVATDNQGWKSQLTWYFTPLKGKKYSIEFKAKATNVTSSNPTTVAIEVIDVWKVINGESKRLNSLAGQVPFLVTSDIQVFKAELPNVVTLTDRYTFMFWLGYLPSGQSLWLDDIKIFQTADPSTGLEYEMVDDKSTCISGGERSINIRTGQAAKALIYSSGGILVKQVEISEGNSTVDIDPGMYIVQIVNSNTILKSTKLVVK